jgi:hypothetical protein
MGYEKETNTRKFLGTELAEGRKKFLFENPGRKDPSKVSAFEPYLNLDALVPGKIYTYEQENVPMLDKVTKQPSGKFFHNFTRRNGTFGKSSTGDYKIDLAEAGAIEAYIDAAPKEGEASYESEPQPQKPQEAKRPGYWDTNLQLLLDRFKLDTEKQPVIVRESVVSSAAVSLQMHHTPKMTREEIAMDVLITAKAFEIFCTNGSLVDAEAWLKDRKKTEQGNLKGGDDE